MEKIEMTLNRARMKYQMTLNRVENQLRSKVDFDFSIEWQPSDNCFMLATDSENTDHAPYNIPISRVLKHIEETGRFAYIDAVELSI